MKNLMKTMFGLCFVSILILSSVLPQAVSAQEGTPTVETPTEEMPSPAPVADAIINATLDSYAKSAAPGTAVTYNLRITNSGDAADTVAITADTDVSLSSTSCTLEAGAQCDVNVQVVIPSTYVNNQYFAKVVTVTGTLTTIPLEFITTAVITVPVTPTAAPFSRPLLVVDSYNAGGAITPGTDFTLKVKLVNTGGSEAKNVVATFESADFLPLETGGVIAVASIGSGSNTNFNQPMRANASLWGTATGAVIVNVGYTDDAGTAYTEKFTITIGLVQWKGSVAATVTPTAQARAQLVVGGYTADINPLQPGSIFNLSIDVRNLGTVDAKSVTLVLGGGVVASSNDNNGQTSQNNGVTTTGSDLTTFAPLGTSNLIFLDAVPVGQKVTGQAQMIVNVSATPGAYPFKLSFTYLNSKGERVVDDQVITLLVYNLPKMDIGFYIDPGIFMTGQMNMLPLQITNLGKTTAVLGNMRVSSEGADITGNVALVGNLEPGGYFTLDAMAMPFATGPLDVSITVNYTDDFNQPKVIEQTLTVNVEEMPVFEPMPGEEGFPGEIPLDQPETAGDKLMRFVKGMLGLGSGKAEPVINYPMEGEIIPEGKPGVVGPKG
ncbi:MAG: hypothetical protein CVU39_12830 [Chloroflexi bacterium HGW-Chloroflexi-10]|nr:MAG: hypothetical protein CVU39_12830 [Chloroflexi bacterium HGW-Chloroflexi-10]